jgi:SynChlorMet cassette radical SAM/SPASM protein ScmE
MRTPRTVDVEITSRCNLRCRYCYYFDNPAVEYHDLPTREWLRFFDEMGQCRVMSVTLQGGEPFIRKDFITLLEGIVRNHMRFSILSNGTLIDDEITQYVADTGRCDYVQVSIDGSCPETHDACRGQGSFEKAIAGIKRLQRYNVRVAVRVTIHRHNVHDLEDTAHLLLEDLRLASFSTNSAGYLGSCRPNADNVLLTPEERQLAMATLLNLSSKYDGRISAMAGPLAEVRTWLRMEKALSREAPAFPGGGHLTGCGCHSSKIAVRADGVIIPCCMLPHIELGRINSDSLVDVWQLDPDLNKLRQRHNTSLTTFGFCDNCVYLSYCTGNCPGLAYTLTGEVDHPSPDGCLRSFLESGGMLPEAWQVDSQEEETKTKVKGA